MRKLFGGKPHESIMKVKAALVADDMRSIQLAGDCIAHHSPVPIACNGAEVERIR